MYLDLSVGNQETLILKPEENSKWIDKIMKDFSWDNYDVYDNRLNQYTEHLFDSLFDKIDEDMDEEKFWSQLTIGQKYFFSFLVFEGQVDNGGLFQFFWNNPEHAYSFLKVIEILQLDKLKPDYLEGLRKYESIKDKLNSLKDTIDTDNDDVEEAAYDAYEKGLSLFGEESKLEDYFYEEQFMKGFHKSMCDYIENNRTLFVG